ncbi:aminotransferase class V-fold PLP-dependent enzyme [Paraburkholderia sp. LEh10]|uniref:aminotransferase class V-fold PLP-dependent enzyme n=1 Tax=Paraburkholderia sp. LEh10 TaxID=2821353 RepID=UPI001AEA15FA|nr:aminotransferase class V-fold PLP-dependent enzyme [Paraburkholderia sp. LEh10]MBP0588495.1 aminotransferase class V-fold PLP-dependent enzyme [Paraburkholderia sp. LEh10]
MSNTSGTRIAGRNILAVPGPTNIPDAVLRAMVVSMEDHRSTKFPELAHGLLSDLKKLYRTAEGQPFIFPSSGTGAWEAALTNTLSPGDRVLVPRFGQFSHLWADMAQRLGFDVEILDVDWGEGVPVERIAEILKADRQHTIKGILACHNETATGVTSDIGALRQAMDAAGHPALLFVDGVSSIGCIDFRMDEWGVDLAVTGSQKGLMLPAGLGILCVSQKALKTIGHAKSRRCYFDLADMVRTNATGYFPYTPALSLLYGLRAALDLLFQEGLENVFARHHYLSSGVRAAVTEGWGLELCAKAPKWHSDTVSAIVVPEGFNAAQVIDTAYRRYNLALGAGLSKVAGKVFRIGHLGDLNELMLMSAIAGAEMAMLDAGIDVRPGSGVGAAGQYWRTHAPHAQAAAQPAAAPAIRRVAAA